jgi:hypothetical protein
MSNFISYKVKLMIFSTALLISLLTFSIASPVIGKSLTTSSSQTQTYKVYVPIITRNVVVIPEEFAPPCRWSRTPGGFIAIPYKWGGNLQNPGTSWRIAFEAAIIDWYELPTKVYYYYSEAGPTTFNTYSAQDTWGGKSTAYCIGTDTSWYLIEGNIFYDQTINGFHAYAGHETGHGQSIGHVADTGVIALMGTNPDPEIYFTPQPIDIDFVNQIYP